MENNRQWATGESIRYDSALRKWVEAVHDTQAAGGDTDDRRIRVGNNRYHQPKAVAKRKRKLATDSRKRNRK